MPFWIVFKLSFNLRGTDPWVLSLPLEQLIFTVIIIIAIFIIINIIIII